MSSFASVERIQEYTQLPQEPQQTKPEDPLPGTWPLDGSLDIQNLHLRHREDLPLVLKDISFRVQPGSKVGIVGRTGAGKSSLVQALFRLADFETGSITIDN